MQSLSTEYIRQQVAAALREDIGSGDATTLATIPESARASARMVAREELVLVGLDLAVMAFTLVSSNVVITKEAVDGDRIAQGGSVLRAEGPARALLSAERVALNFVQRLSGIATLTAEYVRATAGTKARILDTRKTTPGWRLLEKYAVACGGGQNHRFGLYDMILIKDNHLAALRDERPNAVAAAVLRARRSCPALKVEVEADNIEQVAQAAEAGADIILLDNMSIPQLMAAVELVGGRAQTEASGGINLSNVRQVAESGVDLISVGALTHSARSVDLGLDFEGI
jgi:nicotinate-nucleotide pyrophosphorylase (carboxylating)